MQARRTRMTRGVLAAAVSTFAAAFSHGVASGEAPSIVALAVASVLAVAVCVALASRATPARLTVAVVASQAAFHGLFVALPDTSGTATQSGHHGMVVLTADVVTHTHGSVGVAMWLSHAAAAIVTIAALHHGERLLLVFGNTLGLVFRAVIAALCAVSTSTPATTVPSWLPVPQGSTALLPFSANRRGPPLLATARSFA